MGCHPAWSMVRRLAVSAHSGAGCRRQFSPCAIMMHHPTSAADDSSRNPSCRFYHAFNANGFRQQLLQQVQDAVAGFSPGAGLQIHLTGGWACQPLCSMPLPARLGEPASVYKGVFAGSTRLTGRCTMWTLALAALCMHPPHVRASSVWRIALTPLCIPAGHFPRGALPVIPVHQPTVFSANQLSPACLPTSAPAGHSLGGALAVIAAHELTQMYPQAHVAIYTFGAPRVNGCCCAGYPCCQGAHLGIGVPVLRRLCTHLGGRPRGGWA